MFVGVAENVKRLREARRWSQGYLAKQVGVSQTTIDKIERGITTRSKFLPVVAQKLGVPLSQIDDSIAESVTPSGAIERVFAEGMIPIYASAEGGGGAMIITYEPIDYERRPGMLAHIKDAYGFYVVGDSMSPAYEPGDRLLINPHLPPRPGVDAVIFRENGGHEVHALVKRIKAITPDKWTLLQFNPHKELHLSRQEWPRCHVVIGAYNRL